MADTNISWTDAVWNPTSGCAEASPGCKNCYAKVMHKRLTAMGAAKYTQPFHQPVFHPDALTIPLRWRKPRCIFVNSMSDLFYDSFSNEQIAEVFAVMAHCERHTFQILTKRPERALALLGRIETNRVARYGSTAGELLPDCHWMRERCWQIVQSRYDAGRVFSWTYPLPNVHLLVSCEDQQRANERIPLLLRFPAAVRGVSLEPLLGPIDLRDIIAGTPTGEEHWDVLEAEYDEDIGGPGPKLDWVIVGCESGPKRRPCDTGWVRSLRYQCSAAGVPLFVKQLSIDGKVVTELDRFPSDLQIRMFPGDKW